MYSMLTYEAPFRPWYFGKSVSRLTDESARWDPGPGSNLFNLGKLIVHFCWRGCFKRVACQLSISRAAWLHLALIGFRTAITTGSWSCSLQAGGIWRSPSWEEQPAYFRSAPQNLELLSDYIECQASDLEKWKMINSAAAASKDDKRTLMKVHL